MNCGAEKLFAVNVQEYILWGLPHRRPSLRRCVFYRAILGIFGCLPAL